MARIRKFISLSRTEKIIFFRAVFLLVFSRCLLQFKPFKDVVRYFSRKAAGQNTEVVNAVSPAMVAVLLGAASTVVPFSTCLSKSLAGSVLFRAFGYKTLLHIGVTRENECTFEAHAWLTLDGKVMVGYLSDLEKYQELPLFFDTDEVHLL